MNRIPLKIPKNRQKVRIVTDRESVDKELETLIAEARENKIRQFLESEPENIKTRRAIADRLRLLAYGNNESSPKTESTKNHIQPEYFQRFKFPLKSNPIEISLERVSEDSISLDLAAREIQKAYEKGLNDGQVTARATYKTEIQKHRNSVLRFDDIIEQTIEANSDAITQLEDSIIELGVMIAESLVLNEVSKDGNKIISIIQETLKLVEAETISSVSLNPEDIETIKEARVRLFRDYPNSEKIKILPDKTLQPGSAVLETTAGIVDASLKTRLSTIAKSLAEAESKEQRLDKVESELKQLYHDRLNSNKLSTEEEKKKTLERIRIEDIELYNQLLEDEEIGKLANQKSFIEQERDEYRAEQYHKETADEYDEDTDWDESKLERLETSISEDQSASDSLEDTELDPKEPESDEEDS
ncbi:MAG: hypothetical protein Kapaf2KO_20240 [Candidatus Kapaibacteriales bacterium]